MLQGICRAIEDSSLNKSEMGAIIGQFVTTCEIDHHVLCEWSKDICFPAFVQYLLRASYNEDGNRANICAESDLPKTIIQFLSDLALKHPILHDIITANTHLDEFITNHLSKYVEKCYTRSVKSTEIFPLLKFVALIVNSEKLNIEQPQAVSTLIKIVTSLLSNQQLSAWCSAIIAGLHRNSSVASGCLKALPNLLQVKRELSILMSSSDTCVVCAAISAMVTLFSIGTDHVSAMRASVHFIGCESQFPLIGKLAADAIFDLLKRTQLTHEELTTILLAALKAKGIHAVAILNLLIQMNDYHPTIAQIVKVTEYLEQFINVLLDHEEEFIAPCGCQLLVHLQDCDADLFHGVDVFPKVLTNLPSVGEQSYESYVLLLRMVSRCVKKTDVKLLKDAEDFLFTMFLRQIEQNDGFLSLMLFLFLHDCSRHIKEWSMRIKRIVIDTQFPVLVVNVLEESRDHHTTRDALTCIRYFLSHRETAFFDLFSSSFVMLAKNRHKEQSMSLQEAEHERQKNIQVIHELSTIKKDNETEIRNLREAHSQLITAYNEERAQAEQQSCQECGIIADLRAEVASMKALADRASADANSKDVELTRLREENRLLLERLEFMEKTQCDRESASAKLKESILQLDNFNTQNFALRQAEDKLSEVEHTNYQNSQRILELESELRIQLERKKSMEAEMSQLKSELMQEQDRAEQLLCDMHMLEKQNEDLRAVQKDINHVKRKYAAKKKQLEAAVIAADQERRKWESMAKFGMKIRECKANITQEVYAAGL